MIRSIRGLFPYLLLFSSIWATAQSRGIETDSLSSLEILHVTASTDPVERYSRYEISFNLNRTYSGAAPFDPEIIDVSAVFISPASHTILVPAFYTQDFSISNPSYETYTSTGEPYWKVRFAPEEVGTYSFFLRARESSGSAVSPENTFTVVDSGAQGFIRVHATNPLFLQYSDGTQYLPLGHNIAFGDGNPSNLNGTAYYSSLLASLASAKGNWTRIWMTDFERSALEWSSGHWSGFYNGVGVYSLQAAYRIEKILELAQSHGVAVQLVLNDHGQFSSWVDARWSDNPYNSLNGGPVLSSQPGQFFTNTLAIELHKRRLRYLVARYGAFSNLLCWELFNEVQFSGRYTANWFNNETVRRDIRDWHAEMGSWLKAQDPFRHLVSTSSDGSDFGLLWELPEIDLLQVHDYSAPSSQRDLLVAKTVRGLYSTYQKPVMVGEFGLEGAAENNFNPSTYSGTTADREHLMQGTHLHNTLWTAAMTGTGAGLWWWGCYLEPDTSRSRIPPSFPLHTLQYPPLAAFFENEPIAEEGLAPANLTLSQGVVGFGLASNIRAYAWVRDALNTFGSGSAPGNLEPVRSLSGISLTIPGLNNDAYQIEFSDPWTGESRGTLETTISNGQGLTIELPIFHRDIALKVFPQETLVPDWCSY